MTMMNPLHADFDYAEAYPVPKVTLDEFEQFVSVLSGSLGNERADVFSSLLLWVRCGIPSRLVTLGLDDESAMTFAQVMLDHQVEAVTGLSLGQIAEAVSGAVGINARALLLSTDLMSRLCAGFEFMADMIERLTYPDVDLWARTEVLDQLARATGQAVGRELEVNPYVSPAVYEAVKRRWARDNTQS